MRNEKTTAVQCHTVRVQPPIKRGHSRYIFAKTVRKAEGEVLVLLYVVLVHVVFFSHTRLDEVLTKCTSSNFH